MTSKNLAAELDDYLQAQEGRTFDWGAFNCCHFAQGWVQSQEGFSTDLVPKAASKSAVFRAIKEHGGLALGISKALARESMPPAYAQPGDVVLFTRMSSTMLGICVGRTAACLGEGSGNIVHLPMADADVAWAVGTHAHATRGGGA
jgi:hypothetical protein